MTAVLPDIDPLTRLDAEFEIACESPQRRGEAGEFWIVCRGCRTHAAVCSQHLFASRLATEVFVRMGALIVCNVCGREFASFDAAVEVVPIEVH